MADWIRIYRELNDAGGGFDPGMGATVDATIDAYVADRWTHIYARASRADVDVLRAPNDAVYHIIQGDSTGGEPWGVEYDCEVTS